MQSVIQPKFFIQKYKTPKAVCTQDNSYYIKLVFTVFRGKKCRKC